MKNFQFLFGPNLVQIKKFGPNLSYQGSFIPTKYPVFDFLSSRSSAQLASLYTENSSCPSGSFSTNFRFLVPFRYLITHLTSFISLSRGCSTFLLSMDTLAAISGRVFVVRYSNIPINFRYSSLLSNSVPLRIPVQPL